MNTLGNIAKITVKKLDTIKNDIFIHDILNQIARYKGNMYVAISKGGK